MSIRPARFRTSSRGSALLAVLWLSAALGAIAFSVATTVRSETERVSTSEEDVRASYLAQGAIERAILHVQWGRGGGQDNPYFVMGQSQMMLTFPTGNVLVELIPETSKISINTAHVDVLANLMLNVGATPDQAQTIANAIVDWRTPRAEATEFDQLYLSMQPSFRAPHASFMDIEELLNVAGMTPDLFYGTWVRQGQGSGETQVSRLVPRGGARDCLSVFGTDMGKFDANTVQPAVLAAAGASPDEIQAIVERRRSAPFRNMPDLAEFAGGNPALLNHLAIGPHTIYTFRATARMRRPDGSFSDLKRVVSALVKLLPPGGPKAYDLLRWYDRG